jgi:plastocyanin
MSPLSARAPRPTGRGRHLVALAGAALAALVLGSAPAVLAADADVAVANFAFDPQSVTVNVGDSVTWTNGDAEAHTATGDGGSFDTGSIAGGASASVTFDTAGTFAYICSIHPTMTGTVVVEAAAAPTDAPSTTAPPTDTAASGTAGDAGPTFLVILAVAAVAAVTSLRRLAPERRRAG